MTKRSTRVNKHVGALKALLLTGSLIATLAGTRLLALQDTLVPGTTPSSHESTIVDGPVAGTTEILSSPSNRRVQLELQPLPQVVRPQINPVARTRSSR